MKHLLAIGFQRGTRKTVGQGVYFAYIGIGDDMDHLYAIFVRLICKVHLNNMSCPLMSHYLWNRVWNNQYMRDDFIRLPWYNG